MKLFDKKRISIIVENVYRDEVVKLLEKSGVSGFTIYKDIYGKGQSGIKGTKLSDISGNLEIVTIISAETVERIADGLVVMIDNGVLMKVYISDVKVIRDEHFK